MCPRCQSHEVALSKSWRFRDLVMILWGMKPFRCQQCRNRFYLPSKLAQSIQAEHRWLESVRQEKTGQHRHHRPK